MLKNKDHTLTSYIITSNEQIASNAFILSFDRNFTFKAGQVIGLTLSLNEPPRLYSIASGENDKYIKILYDVKPEGKLTPFLAKLKIGDTIYATEPFGKFVYNNKPAYFIGVGTGIAPFASMIHTKTNNDIIVVQGSRFLDHFYFEDEFMRRLGSKYIRCCSAEIDDDVFAGRVTTYLERQDNLPKDYYYYLCGSPEMVVESRDILISKKIPFNQIIAETYF